jgi:hypothetical protein
MGTPKLTPEMCQAAVDALAKHGNQVAAARAMGLSRSALQHRLAEAANPPRDPEVVVEPLTSRERFDAAFWRKKAVEAQRAANEAEHVAEQLAGIRGVQWSIPEWIMGAGDGDKGRSVIGCLVSDMHMGEVIDAGRVGRVYDC